MLAREWPIPHATIDGAGIPARVYANLLKGSLTRNGSSFDEQHSRGEWSGMMSFREEIGKRVGQATKRGNAEAAETG